MTREQYILDQLKKHNLDAYARETLQQELHYLRTEGLANRPRCNKSTKRHKPKHTRR